MRNEEYKYLAMAKRIREENLNTIEHWDELINHPERKKQLIINNNRALSVFYTFPSRGLILDAGCGQGEYMEFWFERNMRLGFCGIDFSESSLERAEKRCPWANIKLADIQKEIPFKLKMFDVVTCMETLEHLDDPQKAADEIYRVTKLDGKIIITVPYKLEIQAPEHVWEFDEHSLKELFPKLKDVAIMKTGSHFENLMLIGIK